MIGSLGAGELLIIMVIVLLLFGGKRMPEIARALGKSIYEFRHSVNSALSDINESIQKVPVQEVNRANTPMKTDEISGEANPAE